MISSPEVTIGIPVFNGGLQLQAAIESIRSQTFVNTEIIICDNCSTDQTPEIGQMLASRDRRLRYHRNEANLGVSKNFLLALELANAPLFMWAAHDDLRGRDYISVLVDALRKTPTATLATARCRFVDSDGRQKPEWGIAPSAAGLPVKVATTLLKSHSTHWIYGLFRTPWLREHVNHFLSVDPWGGDLLLLLRMALGGLITGSDGAMLTKQIRADSLFQPKTPRQIVSWNVRYIGSLIDTLKGSDINWSQRILLYRTAMEHFRTHIAPYDSKAIVTILSRAIYHSLSGADRP
jgi:glycosyltransferase involved in cell wall biosynthesis